jgi:TolA-binding protein
MLSLVIGVVGAASSAVAEPVEDRFAAAADHYRHKRWHEACDEFARLLADDPQNPRAAEARFFYGEALVQRGRWQDARGQFVELLKIAPDGPRAREALFRAGEAAYMTGDNRAANADLETFHKRYADDPLCAYVLPYLASLELQAGHAQRAQELFSQSLARYKDAPLAAESQFGLAQALHQSGQLEKARDGYRSVIASAGPLAEPALFQLGAAEKALGHYQEALESFDQFLARSSSGPLTDKARLGRGYALYKLARYREAQEALSAIAGDAPLGTEAAYWLALAQKSEDRHQAALDTLQGIKLEADHRLAPAVAFHLADALAKTGRADEAGREFGRLVQHFPNSPWADDALVGVLHIAVERKEHAQAIRLADELTAKFPSGPHVAQAALAKGQALAALEKPAEATAILQPLLENSGSDAEVRTRAAASLAVCQARLGRFDAARKTLAVFGEATSQNALFAETTNQVAELALKSGQTSLAQELFARTAADRSAGTASRAQSGLAWSHFQAGRWNEAAEAFAKVLETDPRGPRAAEAALLRGRALEHLEQFEPALEMYRVVIDEHPDSSRVAEALWLSGRLDEQLGRTDDARRSYAQLIERHADFAQLDAALYRYAWLLRPADPAEAGKIFSRLKAEFPKSQFAPDATLRLAEHAFDAQKFAEVETLLTELAGPAVPAETRREALYLSGRLEMARGRWSAAAAPLEKLIAESPDREQSLHAACLLAEADFRQGKYDRAADRLAELAAQTAGRAEPWLAAAELRRAQALAHQRRWSESLEVARAIGPRFPKFDKQYEVDYAIGRALAAQADFAAARETYAKVLASPDASITETAAMAQWMIPAGTPPRCCKPANAPKGWRSGTPRPSITNASWQSIQPANWPPRRRGD